MIESHDDGVVSELSKRLTRITQSKPRQTSIIEGRGPNMSAERISPVRTPHLIAANPYPSNCTIYRIHTVVGADVER